ncbi:MAG TPA: nucleoside phosphorylase [Ktedonobacteraceae bacterium]|nr:nucleoside phosphorylase [Ktedonobacteraceae bacterium]
MPYPNFEGKHAHDAVFHPQDLVAYFRKELKLPEIAPPHGMIFCYERSFFQQILAQEENEAIGPGIHLLKQTDGRIGICGGFGIGAPAATAILEVCVAMGVREFLSIGMAGTLQTTTQIGDLIVCERAIRDEGVSHHYVVPEKYAYPSPALTQRLHESLMEAGVQPTVGTTWTIDAPYRETVEEVRCYQSEGVLTVEMEAAALFAVAKSRGVEMASAFVISDSLAELVWKPHFASEVVSAGLLTLYNAARATLVEQRHQ